MTDVEKIKALVNLVDEICKDVRERHVEDDVCGLCEYDGAYQGESGDWMNECPGFERDDCFCLKKSFVEKYLGTGEKEMTREEAYHEIIENDCQRYCPRQYPNCKNKNCRWYIALEALRTMMIYEVEEAEASLNEFEK